MPFATLTCLANKTRQFHNLHKIFRKLTISKYILRSCLVRNRFMPCSRIEYRSASNIDLYRISINIEYRSISILERTYWRRNLLWLNQDIRYSFDKTFLYKYMYNNKIPIVGNICNCAITDCLEVTKRSLWTRTRRATIVGQQFVCDQRYSISISRVWIYFYIENALLTSLRIRTSNTLTCYIHYIQYLYV